MEREVSIPTWRRAMADTNIHVLKRTDGSSDDSHVAGTTRLTVVLHPNPSRIDIALNDRFFNTERYSFSRKQEPHGAEKDLLDYLQTYIVGVGDAKAAKNVLQLEIEDGVLLREFMPQVITAVKRWGSVVEPYEPEVFVDNRRYDIDPTYDSEGWTTSDGVRQRPGKADIGLAYKVWQAGA
jgi:hypothetical protein